MFNTFFKGGKQFSREGLTPQRPPLVTGLAVGRHLRDLWLVSQLRVTRQAAARG